MKKMFGFVRNKYIVTTIVFVVWVSFFDERDLYTTFQLKKKLNAIILKKKFFEQGIAQSEKQLDALKDDHESIERYAREQFLMRKDGEDIFLVDEPDSLKF